ncbi:uncharacterized protein [Macrobrachium rosenbergii]|uniref:uncharacterized protein n=1 Tax=Macrobrachium rosenbergii TaxID=79674 RepID=UPI0034D68ACE
MVANRSPILFYGTRLLSISILGRRYSWNFVVADVRTLLLGVDFLARFGLAVDVGRKRLLDTDSCQSLLLATGPSAPTICSVAPHQYTQLLNKFPDVFRTELRQVPGAPAKHGIYHNIKTKGPPTHARFLRLPPRRLQEAKNAFAEMEQMGICKKASSPWASPLRMVQKPDSSWRPCSDYRQLNLATEPDHYPLLNMQDLTASFHGAKTFSKLDLLKSYFQVPVAPEDIPKTAIITPFGSYIFAFSTFGLRNVGATFQRLMDSILGDLKKNPVADTLSRIELNVVQLGINYEDLAREQTADPVTPAHRTAITSLKWRDMALALGGPNLLCDISTGQPRPLVLASRHRQVFDVIHGLSHPSGRMTAKLLTEKFIWHGMWKDARAWTRQCLWCQTSKVSCHTESGVGEFPQPGRSLKASLMARCTAEDWKYQLPWVLLGLRTAPRANGDPSAAEKIYGKPLVVPGELVTEDRHNPSVQRLHDIVGQLPSCRLACPPTTHVFIRDDAVRPPLTRPYKGPFRVLERNNKAFRLALHGKDDWVSVDRIKPALLEEDTDVTAPHPLPEQSSPQPGRRRKRTRGARKHPPTPAASRSHAQRNPPLTSRSRGTLQCPSRYID